MSDSSSKKKGIDSDSWTKQDLEKFLSERDPQWLDNMSAALRQAVPKASARPPNLAQPPTIEHRVQYPDPPREPPREQRRRRSEPTDNEQQRRRRQAEAEARTKWIDRGRPQLRPQPRAGVAKGADHIRLHESFPDFGRCTTTQGTFSSLYSFLKCQARITGKEWTLLSAHPAAFTCI